jgi:hypothetical protein
MTIKEMLNITGTLPNKATLSNGECIELQIEKNSLGYVAYLWKLSGLGYKDYVIQFGTGHTIEIAKDSLKKKLSKDLLTNS